MAGFKSKKMKYSVFILFLLIFCTGKKKPNSLGYFENSHFTFDTVIVDFGQEIAYLKNSLFSFDKSKDDIFFYNFNFDDHTLDKINSNKLSLLKKIPFEKEGPNGTGPFVGRINILDENHVLFHNMFQSSLYSLEGEKLSTIYFENFSIGGNPLEGGEDLRFNRVLDNEANRLYGLIYKSIDRSLVLGILYLENFVISRLNLKTFEKIPNYTFVQTFGGGSMWIRSPEIEIEKFGKKVILSNQITSSLMWYDTELDSLFMKSYKSNLTANDKVNEYKLEHETEESFLAEYNRFQQEINFLAPFWDQKNQVFYRFSYQGIPSESFQEEPKAKVNLTVFDKDLNQLGEALIPQLTKKPAKHFAKDGKIWIYENINDEMGFVVLTINK